MRWYAGAVGLTALACLYFAAAWWVAVTVLLLVALAAKRFPGTRAKGLLYISGWDGVWWFEHDALQRNLTLLHVWHGPVWTAFRFRDAATGEPLHLTVWRREVSSKNWRLLRQLALRGARSLSPRTEAQ